MSVYYYFYNITRDEQNETFISPYDLSFVPNLNSFSEENVLNIFLSLIELNGWEKTDCIQAEPDYSHCSLIEYNNGVIEYIESEESEEIYEEDYDF